MSRARDGLARSVQVRLERHAKAIGVDPNLVLVSLAGGLPREATRSPEFETALRARSVTLWIERSPCYLSL